MSGTWAPDPLVTLRVLCHEVVKRAMGRPFESPALQALRAKYQAAVVQQANKL